MSYVIKFRVVPINSSNDSANNTDDNAPEKPKNICKCSRDQQHDKTDEQSQDQVQALNDAIRDAVIARDNAIARADMELHNMARKMLNEWQVNMYANNRFLHRISAALLNEKYQEFITLLRSP